MKRYIKASTENKDIIITYRNKIIYDGPISVEPAEMFKNIRNFNPEDDYHDKFLVGAFERNKDDLEWPGKLFVGYRNAIVAFWDKEKFDPTSIEPKAKADPNTAVIDGERYTAKEIAQEVMSEADNYEYVYNGYQDILADYARKVVENGWTGTWRDKVPFEAIKYVVSAYLGQHSARKKNIASMCRPLITEYMQEDYDRYKRELNI